MNDLGITGARSGMTQFQYPAAEQLLTSLAPDRVHHGDCVGVDAEIHELATFLGIAVTIHPPVQDTYRAFCTADRIEAPKPYLARNRAIVDQSGILLAFPDGEERLRSGTWTTIRYAGLVGVTTVITFPDGRREYR